MPSKSSQYYNALTTAAQYYYGPLHLLVVQPQSEAADFSLWGLYEVSGDLTSYENRKFSGLLPIDFLLLSGSVKRAALTLVFAGFPILKSKSPRASGARLSVLYFAQ